MKKPKKLQDYANKNVKTPPKKNTKTTNNFKFRQMRMSESIKQKHENNKKLQDYGNENVLTSESLQRKNTKTRKNYKIVQMRMSKPLHRKARKQQKATRLWK